MDGDDLATQKLETQIVINARTGNGFSEVGNTLTELGTLVDGMSQQLISFGKDSINVYRDYEKSMKDAEVALSTTYGRNTRELSQVMGLLDASATEWAATTIFHTNDVANAISNAAHAGWDYEQIMSGIPAAIQLAQAGSLDLSQAVDYIVKSTNAAGIEFDSTAGFIDLWTMAANSSASTIEEFGDAMLRMGSTMRFTDSTEELMTLLAVTANAGSVGSEAGTLIRNSIIRLIAPTEKASDAMGVLGATSEEAADLMDDAALSAANARLEAMGFSAFDENNQLKSILDIYRELYVALGDINGGFENLEDNGDVLEIMNAIFPARTITEALTLLRGAADNYDDLYDKMMNGEAAGYGAYAAETMMDTLNGRIETFESKVERLKQLVGEELSGQVSSFLGMAGDFIDSISEMDEGKFSTLVSGIEVIAFAGPGLIAAGSAFRLLGTLLGPGGAIAIGTIGLVTLAETLAKMEEVNLSNGFGIAEMDHEAINSRVREIGSAFEESYTKIYSFRDAVEQSMTTYQTASSTLSSELLTALTTGTTLSKPDIDNLNSLGEQMHNAVLDGINNSKKESLSYMQLLFGGSWSSVFNKDYQNIANITNNSFSEAIAEAESIGEQIRNAMTAAFDDGTINQDEYSKIQGYIKSYNDAITRASNEAKGEEDYINRQMLLHRAQTASYEELQAITEEITSERDRVLGEAEDEYLRQRYGLEYRYNQAIANGSATEAERDKSLRALEREYNSQRITQSSKYDDLILNSWGSQLKQSGFSDLYGYLEEMADAVMYKGWSYEGAERHVRDRYGNNKYAGETDWLGDNIRTQLGEVLQQEIVALGGYEDISAKILNYQQNGDAQSAAILQQLYTMQQINDKFFAAGSTYHSGMQRETVYSDVQGASHSLSEFTGTRGGGGSATFSVQGDTTQLQADIDEIAQQNITLWLYGDNTNLTQSVDEQDNRTLLEYVTGDTSQLEAAINALSGRSVSVNIRGRGSLLGLYAEGGRSDTAAIFGEAGPEWAIPEEHTKNTANLLNAAREASGFTWGELISNSRSSGNGPSTVIYSPTVYANDARGVDEVLLNDKKRLDKWYEEREMRDRMEVYT